MTKRPTFSRLPPFSSSLEKVSSHEESAKCLEHLKHLKNNRVTNVVESELQTLLLQCHFLDEIKEEITEMKNECSSSDKSTKGHERNPEEFGACIE